MISISFVVLNWLHSNYLFIIVTLQGSVDKFALRTNGSGHKELDKNFKIIDKYSVKICNCN